MVLVVLEDAEFDEEGKAALSSDSSSESSENSM
jgi:hypothetical protein